MGVSTVLNSSIPRDASVNTLVESGARLLRVHPDKSPAESRGWAGRQLTLDDALDWHESGGLLGLQPESLGLTILDVDHGPASNIEALHPPMTTCRTPRGFHLVYRSEAAYPGRSWTYQSCAGDVRSRMGSYAVLWEPILVADAVTGAPAGVDFASVWACLDFPPATRAKTSPRDRGSLGRHNRMLARLLEARQAGVNPDELVNLAQRLWQEVDQPPRADHLYTWQEASDLTAWVNARSWDVASQRARGALSMKRRRQQTGLRDATIARLL